MPWTAGSTNKQGRIRTLSSPHALWQECQVYRAANSTWATPSPSIANLPNPLFVRAFIDDDEVSITRNSAKCLVQSWDLRTGVYRYSCEYVDDCAAHTGITMERLCDMEHVHRVAMRYALKPMGRPARIRIQSGIDGSVRSNLRGERQFAIHFMDAAEGVARMEGLTRASRIEFQIEISNRWSGARIASRRYVVEHERVYEEIDLEVEADEQIVLEKYAALASSEAPIAEPPPRASGPGPTVVAGRPPR